MAMQLMIVYSFESLIGQSEVHVCLHWCCHGMNEKLLRQRMLLRQQPVLGGQGKARLNGAPPRVGGERGE